MQTSLFRYLERSRHGLEALRRSTVFTQEHFLVAGQVLNLEQTALRLERAIPTGLTAAQTTAREATQRLRTVKATILGERAHALSHLHRTLTHRGTSLTSTFEKALATAAASLESLSPLAVLSRGYALGFDGQQRLLRTVEQVQEDEEIRIRLADGSIRARVTAKE